MKRGTISSNHQYHSISLFLTMIDGSRGLLFLTDLIYLVVHLNSQKFFKCGLAKIKLLLCSIAGGVVIAGFNCRLGLILRWIRCLRSSRLTSWSHGTTMAPRGAHSFFFQLYSTKFDRFIPDWSVQSVGLPVMTPADALILYSLINSSSSSEKPRYSSNTTKPLERDLSGTASMNREEHDEHRTDRVKASKLVDASPLVKERGLSQYRHVAFMVLSLLWTD